jgi:hypothetical protein
MRTRSWPVLLLSGVLACALTSPAFAGDDATPTETESGLPPGWRLEFVPYLWLSSIKGTSTVGGRTVGVDVGYKELFDLIGDHFSLLAGMGHLEVGYERLFGFVDVVGTRLDTDQSARLEGITDPSHPQLSTSKIDAAVNLRLDTVFFEFAGGYRALELALPNRRQPFYVDAIAGGRYNYFWTRVHASASTKILGLPQGSQAVGQAVAGGGDLDWVDPFIGLRFGVPLTDDIALMFRGDIGGFGAGSDLAWSLVSGLQYRIPYEPVTGVHPWFALGYKAYAFDYDSGSLAMDLVMQGPVTAIGLTF